MFDIIQTDWRKLVHDIETAKPKLDSLVWSAIPNDLRKMLIERLQPPNPELAKQITDIMSSSTLPVGWGKQLFPELIITQSCSGAALLHHNDKLKNILGSGVQLCGECYSSTEGVLGINLGYTSLNQFTFAVRFCYFELIPEEQWNEKHPECVLVEHSELNKLYEVVITNYNGLYRYRMGDIIKIIDYRNGNLPVFELVYRRSSILNHFGEHVTEQQIISTLQRSIKQLNEQLKTSFILVDYCATSVNENNLFYHRLFIELNPQQSNDAIILDQLLGYLFGHHNTNQELENSLKNFALFIDKDLCDSNYFYSDERLSSRLQSLDILLCKQGTFIKLKQGKFFLKVYFIRMMLQT
ncbi:unnamed protein product [Didymodactylos carnosus]|uniref:GH3 auxin-responsive promoter n=1 Tax=Didymodactylos carnosus TaxID=1234261 RepID=A0A8S2I236_9BILA|nr:unnamed protein product [Didymodactylos carnosus]CAF3710255.1 unnamed protein product [Didymodactylos carnosus]